jgi:hypothetical protein
MDGNTTAPFRGGSWIRYGLIPTFLHNGECMFSIGAVFFTEYLHQIWTLSVFFPGRLGVHFNGEIHFLLDILYFNVKIYSLFNSLYSRVIAFFGFRLSSVSGICCQKLFSGSSLPILNWSLEFCFCLSLTPNLRSLSTGYHASLITRIATDVARCIRI